MCFSLVSPIACSKAQVAPVYTPEQVVEAREQQIATEMPVLNELEEKYGSENSQVKQMKLELGLGHDNTELPDQEVERADTMTKRDTHEQAGSRRNYE
jgi:hypothetical protein